MVRRRVDQVADAVTGELVSGNPMAWIDGAALDSRAVNGGELFVALHGERTDGHRFIGDAAARGATAALVECPAKPVPDSFGQILVDDSVVALHALTRRVRMDVPERLVAITGSAGKTTTKEMLSELLQGTYRVAASPGNRNNLLGFPLALLGIPDDCQIMVAEMGMSEPGELGQVSRLGSPDVCLFTNVAPAHLAGFESGDERASLEHIMAAKAELLDGMGESGWVVANADDPQVVKIAELYQRRQAHAESRVVWFSMAGSGPQEQTYRCRDLRTDFTRLEDGKARPSLALEIEPPGQSSFEVHLPLYGEVNGVNFLAACACAMELGVGQSEIRTRAAGLVAHPGRGRLVECGDVLLIDDTYNSNPVALEAALDALRATPAGRRVAILGAMLELGNASDEHHRRLGRLAGDLDVVLGVGAEARPLVEAAARAGAQAQWVETAKAASEWALSEIGPQDLVLIKGSRGIRLEETLVALEGSLLGGFEPADGRGAS